MTIDAFASHSPRAKLLTDLSLAKKREEQKKSTSEDRKKLPTDHREVGLGQDHYHERAHSGTVKVLRVKALKECNTNATAAATAVASAKDEGSGGRLDHVRYTSIRVCLCVCFFKYVCVYLCVSRLVRKPCNIHTNSIPIAYGDHIVSFRYSVIAP